jgi:hypothetical protein
MTRPIPNGRTRKNPPTHDIQCVLPGETRISSPDKSSDFGQNLLTRNRFRLPAPNFFPASDHLSSPDSLDFIGIRHIQALDQPVSQERPFGYRQMHRLLGQLFYS